LWEYRGTRIFYEAIERILKEFDNVLVTIAGDGPDEIWLKDRLGKNQNVEFICYSSHESLLIHSNKQIAVIPTVGSEGTSLSLLEAMASKCAVICTDVGGLTNVIIDGYNGIIVPAGEPNALYEAIKNLIIDETLRENVANMGYETVATSFSLSKWKSAWAQKIKLISGQC
jgi:glycosyltransferase involved in cell wall biosynthesis